jgi:geranylgeranyl pyrophosphate synthase
MTKDYKKILGALEIDAALTEKKIDSLYGPASDPAISLLLEAERYSLFAGGKRVRPFLVLEFARAFKGSAETALSFAAGIEMMHTFSLIHDDLPCMDDDDLRRGVPTSHKKFGEATALLAGDSLSIKAFEAVLCAPSTDPSIPLRAGRELSFAAGSTGMAGGQMIDLRGEKDRLSFDELLLLHSLKTGAMIKLACRLGCISAGIAEKAPEMEAADGYSSRIGLVFQIVDDILDAVSDPSVLGKSTGGDAEHNKTTFMTYMNPVEAYAYAKRLTDEAVSFLKGPEFELLREFAYFLLDRKK